MSDHIDDWRKLKSFDTNIQAELHANLLKNNGINVSQQALSGIPGMNSGGVLWVKVDDLAQAQRILDSIDVDGDFAEDSINDDKSINPVDDNPDGAM